MITSDELELKYQLLRRNNPDWSDEKLRQEMFKRAMEAAVMDFSDEMDRKNPRLYGHYTTNGQRYCGGIR